MALADKADPRTSHNSQDDRAEASMGFLEHLDELRTRLIRSVIAIAAGMVVAYFLSTASPHSCWHPRSR